MSKNKTPPQTGDADGALSPWLEKFLHRLRWVRQLSAHTVAAYKRDLQLLAEHARAENKKPQEINAAMLRAIIARQTARGSHPSSIARQLAAWRVFFDFMREEGALTNNPARRVRAPKKPSRLPRALTPEQTQQFLDAAPNKKDENKNKRTGAPSNRDAAMFELLYSSGVRVGELIALDVHDLDAQCRFVTVRSGKGGGGRVVPVGATAKAALCEWLSSRAQMQIAESENALFVNRGGGRLSARAVQQRMRKRAICAGMGVPVSPHVLRHSCASHFLQSSGDLRATQEMLGHKDITATQIYTRLDFQNLAKTYDKAHPRARPVRKEEKKV